MIDPTTTQIKDVAWCFVDVETTGLDKKEDRIIEVSAIRYDVVTSKRYQTQVLNTLVNPGQPIDENGEAFKVNGISNAMVLDAPPWATVGRWLDNITKDAVFIAFNARFDWWFIRWEHRRAGFELPPAVAVLCALNGAKKFLPGMWARGYNYTLNGVLARLELEVGGPAHRAQRDAIACEAIFERLIATKLEGWTISEASSYLGTCDLIRPMPPSVTEEG